MNCLPTLKRVVNQITREPIIMTEQQSGAGDPGASRGIGKAIVRAAAAGFIVVGTATSDAGAQASEYLHEAGNAVCGMTLNVADEDSVSSVVEGITEQFWSAAGAGKQCRHHRDNILMRMKIEEWSDDQTNLTALYR